MLDRLVEVRETSLGHGVFALRGLPCSVQVGVLTGRIVSGQDYSSDYAVDVSEDESLEPDPPFRYLNHSCEPNCELVVWEEDDELGELCVYTTREISAGEELTIDYSWPAAHAIPCLCGTLACRGWIVAEDELDELLDSVSGPDQP